uniref:site-specific DNA-methyltransferase (adenine-specific) n=1 Tax=Fervidobacterium pennivorans TaxID=93466 RepID=A0A7V4KE03_FERPE
MLKPLVKWAGGRSNLNKHCYNGLWRVNKSGKFSVPFGRFKNPSLPSKEHVFEFSNMLRNIEILRL